MNIYDLKLEDLEKYLLENEEKKFNAKVIYDWLYKKYCFNFNEMTNLSLKLRNKLVKEMDVKLLKIKKKISGKLTTKFLFELNDGTLVETVLMQHDYGNSVCVSSQVGCNMACAFCASGKLKFKRNLNTNEMVLQVLTIIFEENIKINSVVIMGIGEPFLNYNHVMDFIKIVNNPYGLEIGIRHITISTCGIIPGIEKLMQENMQINLAISLHAANDELRSKLMPVNKMYNLSQLIVILKKYIAITNRRVTIEYVLIKDINDSIKDAEELVQLISGMNVYVNLIPYNKVEENAFEPSLDKQKLLFYDILKKNNINVTIRKEFGSNISAACGQLRAKEEQQ